MVLSPYFRAEGILKGVNDPSAAVRKKALGVLTYIVSFVAGAGPALVGALADDDARVREAAVQALTSLPPRNLPTTGQEAAWGVITNHADPEVRGLALQVLRGGAREHPAFVARVALPRLHHDDIDNRTAAFELLRHTNRDAAVMAVPALIEALADPEVRIRDEATSTLRWLGPDAVSAVPSLVAIVLGNPDAGCCKGAIGALTTIDPGLRLTFRHLAAIPDEAKRTALIRRLVEAGPQAADLRRRLQKQWVQERPAGELGSARTGPPKQAESAVESVPGRRPVSPSEDAESEAGPNTQPASKRPAPPAAAAVEGCGAGAGTGDKPNEFRYAGGDWQVCYGDKSFLLPRRVGFFYIALLLRHPHKVLSPAELHAAYTRFQCPDSRLISPYDGPLSSELQQCLESKADDLGEVMDREGYAAVRRVLEQLNQDIDAAARAGDEMEVQLLSQQKQRLEDCLHKSYQPNGRPRRLSGKVKRDRDQVCIAIDRAVEATQKRSPALGRHLYNSLTRGYLCCYSPDPPICWNA